MSQALEFQSRRRFPRRQFLRHVGFLYEGQYHVGFGCEVGEGGISLSLPHDFPLDTEAVISFLIPGGSFISVRVQLRNIARDNQRLGHRVIGCSFQNLKFENKREVRTYVSARPAIEK